MSSYHHFYKELEGNALKAFPSLKSVPVAWDHLISPIEIALPRSVIERARQAIRALHEISRRTSYRDQLEPLDPISKFPPKNSSLLMAYDFHTDEQGGCHLVEINTNGSGYLMVALMQATHEQRAVHDLEPLKKLRASFAQELKHVGNTNSSPLIAITDDDVDQQKMYPEFLMYRDWCAQAGWRAEICEAREISRQGQQMMTPNGTSIDLLYNRCTDFYLEDSSHEVLRQAYVDGISCISPNPYEYWLLGDKQRLIQLGQDDFLRASGASAEEIAAIQKVIIPTFDKSHFASEEEIWSQRKHLFFKPKRSHGGKSVYRGESVSRKVFERLMQEDILIQRYVPAQKVPADDSRSVLNNWKFDVRFFVYGDEIQQIAARIYQGQVTNFASPMGGFTLVQQM